MSAISLSSWRRLEHSYDLLRELVARDLKMRYKRSIFGFAWSMINPLAQILMFTFLFNKVLPLNIPNYTAFVFTGVLAWSWFSSALLSAPGTIVYNGELVRRPGFPVSVLPIVTVTTNGIHYLLALPILVIFAVAGGGGIQATILALPLIIALQFCITLGLTYMIAASHVRFRDTQHIVNLVVMLGFYITPVFYHAGSVPDQYRLVYDLNPMAALLTSYRAVLIDGQWPSPLSIVSLSVISAVLLILGYIIFDKASARFVEEL